MFYRGVSDQLMPADVNAFSQRFFGAGLGELFDVPVMCVLFFRNADFSFF